ncbi:MAG: FtsW/RodA/SpoVE family cell cycle protein [Bacillota bacterium]
MNRLWRQLAIATNWPVIVAVVVLSSLGYASILARASFDIRFSGDPTKQLLFIGLGMVCMFLMQMLSYQQIGRWAWFLYFLSLFLLIYTILPGMPSGGLFCVVEANNARAWINLGFTNFQPAELTKVTFCMILARYLRFRSNYRTLGGLLPPFALAVVPLLLILKQPDLGTALVFIPSLFAMLFVAGAKIRHLLAIMGIAILLAPLAWYAGPKEKTGLPYEFPVLKHMPVLVKAYQRDRVYALFSDDPAVLRKTGFQQEQAQIAFGSGGLSGRGAMNIPVGRSVPEAHNDMIFALIGEQFGFIGSALLLGAYLVLFTTGIEIASATREPFGRLVAVGTVSLLAGQTFLNLMVALKLMPVTGITLPFVSYGGSSLLASFIAVGLLLNIGQNRPLVMAKNAFEYD